MYKRQAEYGWRGAVPDEARFDLVFTGKMDYRPNVDGMLWLSLIHISEPTRPY